MLGIVLFAVTTTRPWEVDRITEGVGAIYLEAWDRFARHAEQSGVGYLRGSGRLVDAYARLLDSPDPDTRDAASQAWAEWEDAHIAIDGNGPAHRDSRWDDTRYRHAFAWLTSHYWSHNAFSDPPLLERVGVLPGIPAILIHGRRDVSGPAGTAWLLHQSWPGSELFVVEHEGHGGPDMVAEWERANRRLLARVERPAD